MIRKIIFMLLITGSISGLLYFLVYVKRQQFEEMTAAGEVKQVPPQSVSTSVVERQLWPQELQAIGSVEPVMGVQLEAELPGVVRSINFENGQNVNKGDVLVQLDVAPEAALLKSNRANADLAKIELDRAQRLRDTNSVAQSELDRAQASYDVAIAQVTNTEAIIEQKTIRAPFTGRVGIRRINLGQYLSPGTPIVTLQSYDQVFVNFTLPQQAMSRVATGMKITLSSETFGDRTFEGSLTAISPQVDAVTRTIELQGTLDNSQGLLKPGLFVNVRLTLSEDNEVLAIPSTAIVYAPYGNSIFRINRQTDEDTGKTATTVTQCFIRIGERKGDFVSILEGLEEGDEVVSAGAFKLRNNAPVSIQNDLVPSPQIKPDPRNS